MAKRRGKPGRTNHTGKPKADERQANNASNASTNNATSDVKEHELRIELRSDLCSGCGDGFSSGIDSDVEYDKKGIPIISGRRIKGCLREAARDLDYSNDYVNRIFGEPAAVSGGLVSIGDARLSIPVNLVVESSVFSSPSETLDVFTYTRAQTKMNSQTGTVEDNTLRYMRVVKRYLPVWSDDEHEKVEYQACTFAAPVTFDASVSEEDVETFKNVVLALRNIGLNRNRGFGAVRCKLDSANGSAEGTVIRRSYTEANAQGNSQRMVAISYMIETEGPLMLPQQRGGSSCNCIPGTSVQGFFASKLAKRLGSSFDDFFLSGNVRFSPLYPVDKDGYRCLPAPAFIVKLKGGNGHDEDARYADGRYENILALDEEKLRKYGVTPKPQKDGYVGRDWLPVELATETMYHHSTGNTAGADAMLYTQKCLSAGNTFAGFIEMIDGKLPGSDYRYSDYILEVVRQGRMNVGRSKSAQYSRCRFKKPTKNYSMRERNNCLSVKASARYAFLLESDVALVATWGKDVQVTDSSGCSFNSYTTDADALLKALCEVSEFDLQLTELLPMATTLSSHMVGGYNAKWNQKKPHMRVFAAGSTLAFVAKKSVNVSNFIFTVGERQGEGFGRVRLIELDAIQTPIDQGGDDRRSTDESYEERCRASAIGLAQERMDSLSSLTPSFVGRLSLIARQSSCEADFLNRIGEIKDPEKEAIATYIYNELKGRFAEIDENRVPDWLLMQECVTLVLRLTKYRIKSIAAMKKAEEEAGHE